MSENVAKIEAIKVQEFNVKQSKYSVVGSLPTRSIICAPSGGGKTNLLVNLILDVYRGCFSRVYIFSPSIDVDYTWHPVKKYIANEMKVQESEDDKFYYDNYDEVALENITYVQHKIIEYMKENKYKNLYQILNYFHLNFLRIRTKLQNLPDCQQYLQLKYQPMRMMVRFRLILPLQH
jgi:hypothetical protein